MSKLFVILGIGGLGAPEVLILLLLALAVVLLPGILYLVTLQRALQQVSPELRRMSPGSVWLLLIPLFGIIWNFILVGGIADSLAAEYRKRNLPLREARPGYGVGMAMCILQVCSIIPFLGTLSAIAGMICWIVYWVRIAGYRSVLQAHPGQFSQAGQQYQYPPVG